MVGKESVPFSDSFSLSLTEEIIHIESYNTSIYYKLWQETVVLFPAMGENIHDSFFLAA
jgi:hypothetical protein